ncbi:hypothetical protein NHP190012_02510 [Helicobacter sp. NHP19-012]|uniref:Anthranilate synthase component I N-terminal domain-containing protein n=1 Tax=Helicobacter gastrofelis TaxID=2849642 RepID=A0ABN6I4W1_9HELI|nr:hypothetical protein NHP190012_02510 [Helicobacter sp. NHP19-012]
MLSLHQQAPYTPHPLALYAHLQGEDTLLLESAQVENKKHTKSIILAKACLKLVCQDAKVRLEALNANGQALLEKMAKVLELEPKNGVLEKQYAKDTSLKDEFSKLKSASPLDTLRAVFKSVDTSSVPAFGLFCGGILVLSLSGRLRTCPL